MWKKQCRSSVCERAGAAFSAAFAEFHPVENLVIDFCLQENCRRAGTDLASVEELFFTGP